MKTNQKSCVQVFCHNCNVVVGKDETSLVLAQGLMMPIIPKYEGDDGRFGFSIILRVCPTCDEGLLSCNPKKFFKRFPVAEGFALAELDTFRAGFDDQKGYYIRRVTKFPAIMILAPEFEIAGLYERVPRWRVGEPERIIVGRPEPIIMSEENRHSL